MSTGSNPVPGLVFATMVDTSRETMSMGEPGAGVSILGVKMAPSVAGFVGALISLQYLAKATLTQRVVALMTGAATAAYVAPALNMWLGLGGQTAENATAFLLGALAMNLMAGLVELGQQLRRNPDKTLGRVAGFFRGRW